MSIKADSRGAAQSTIGQDGAGSYTHTNHPILSSATHTASCIQDPAPKNNIYGKEDLVLQLGAPAAPGRTFDSHPAPTSDGSQPPWLQLQGISPSLRGYSRTSGRHTDRHTDI